MAVLDWTSSNRWLQSGKTLQASVTVEVHKKPPLMSRTKQLHSLLPLSQAWPTFAVDGTNVSIQGASVPESLHACITLKWSHYNKERQNPKISLLHSFNALPAKQITSPKQFRLVATSAHWILFEYLKLWHPGIRKINARYLSFFAYLGGRFF